MADSQEKPIQENVVEPESLPQESSADVSEDVVAEAPSKNDDTEEVQEPKTDDKDQKIEPNEDNTEGNMESTAQNLNTSTDKPIDEPTEMLTSEGENTEGTENEEVLNESTQDKTENEGKEESEKEVKEEEIAKEEPEKEIEIEQSQTDETVEQSTVKEAGDSNAENMDGVKQEEEKLVPEEPTDTLVPSSGPPDKEEQPAAEKSQEVPPPPLPLPQKSAVETATPRDILATFREEQTQPLSIDWTFGFNRHVTCLNLSDPSRNLVMYASAHVAVLYDFENNAQKLLLGHSNSITCMACSSDKRWLVTADKGLQSSVIIWDSYTGIPVQTIFNVPGDRGVVGIAMSPDAKYIVTLSAEEIQTVSVWDWTNPTAAPIASTAVDRSHGVQTFVHFHCVDNEQFVTNSDSQVLFFSWATGKLKYNAPFLSDETFNRAVGSFSQSLYQEDSKQALTATSYGNIVVWDPDRHNKKNGSEKHREHHKRALKLVRLQERAITTLTQTDGFIVTGDVAGIIRFYDSSLNLVNWYKKDVEMGPVASISFKYDPEFDVEILAEISKFPENATLSATPFVVRDFSVSTKSAEIFNIHADGSEFGRILCEHDASIHAVATSPTKPWLCIGSYSGLLKIWNYETKQCIVSRVFDKGSNIQCLAFDHSGLQLAVGMTNGSVHILDSISLTEELEKPFRYARDMVTHIAFSHDSKYLATADADFATTVFEYNADVGWKYLGRNRAHYKTIKDLVFGVDLDSNLPRLLTLGEDRSLVEYDLQNSSKDDLRLSSLDRIEQSAVPNCLSWYPSVTKESFLLTANDHYKFKLYNTTTKMCRKTLLAPTYGSSIRKILPLPRNGNDADNKTGLLAYITKYKVGLQLLPLDGNPHKSVALVGHPKGVSHLSSSYDGKYLFTAGGKDSCVHMWSLSSKALEAAASLGGEGLTPFYGLLEGGRDGELFAELENYFYYAQLCSQGLDTTEAREVSTVIPLDRIPYVMRALGFYPSEQEIEDMLNEVKFSEYVETGKYVKEIDLADFIKLYTNHRPAFGLSPDEIIKAFQTLGITITGGEHAIDKVDFYNVLQRKGEHMTEKELSEYLSTLIGINDEGGSTLVSTDYSDDDSQRSYLDLALPEQITSSMFTEEILGLPVYDGQ